MLRLVQDWKMTAGGFCSRSAIPAAATLYCLLPSAMRRKEGMKRERLEDFEGVFTVSVPLLHHQLKGIVLVLHL